MKTATKPATPANPMFKLDEAAAAYDVHPDKILRPYAFRYLPGTDIGDGKPRFDPGDVRDHQRRGAPGLSMPFGWSPDIQWFPENSLRYLAGEWEKALARAVKNQRPPEDRLRSVATSNGPSEIEVTVSLTPELRDLKTKLVPKGFTFRGSEVNEWPWIATFLALELRNAAKVLLNVPLSKENFDVRMIERLYESPEAFLSTMNGAVATVADRTFEFPESVDVPIQVDEVSRVKKPITVKYLMPYTAMVTASELRTFSREFAF